MHAVDKGDPPQEPRSRDEVVLDAAKRRYPRWAFALSLNVAYTRLSAPACSGPPGPAPSSTMMAPGTTRCPACRWIAIVCSSGGKIPWLDRATKGSWDGSPRYRAILRPLGPGDELRVALRTGDTCWAVMCLHRESACTGFTAEEAAGLAAAAGHLGAALRRRVLEREDETPLAVTADCPHC